jgi:hypothetical protein
MKYLALLSFLLIVGCTTVPVDRNFPKIPQELKESCPDLKTIPDNSKMSEVVEIIVSNYGQYKECQIKVDSWIKWYNDQQKIFDGVK